MAAKKWAYYSENDPVAAEWLRSLITANQIAPGEVDERDIRDVAPADVMGFAQCHWFAGIGLWSAAFRRAGWDDGRELWTGSCPCQPFSAAGAGAGFDDERHLWPHWYWLISQCRPEVVAGEQVAGKDGLGWLDLVSHDLGGAGYALGAVNLCAAGFGMGWRGSAESQRLERAIRLCPDPLVARNMVAFADWADQSLGIGGFHRRQRLYFIALADEPGGGRRERGDAALAGPGGHLDGGGDATGQLVDGERPGLEGLGGDAGRGGESGRRGEDAPRSVAAAGNAGAVADPDGGQPGDGRLQSGGQHGLEPQDGGANGGGDSGPRTGAGLDAAADADHGGRGTFDWLFCRDGYWRPVEAGTFPLVNADKARVGKLRAFGNGLDFETATRFSEVIVEIANARH